MFFPHIGVLAVLLAAGAFALQPAQDGGAKREKPKNDGSGGLALMAELRAQREAAAAAGEADHVGEEDDDDGAEKDDPIGRRKWFGEWFGPVTAEHLDLVTHVGEKEIAKWGHLIPGTPNYRKPLVGAGIPAGVWRSIGPLDGSSLQVTSYNDNIVDSGRPTTIVPHPTNSSVLYVGFAGGGLWRCNNATLTNSSDWVWEPLTDGLPGGGNQSVGAAALDPDDPNKVYMSLGDMMSGSAPRGTAHGRGFYISQNGGATWVRGGELGKCTRTKTVLPLGGGKVLVAGNYGLFNSMDGGMTFTRNQSGPLKDGTGETYSGQTYLPNEFASAWDIIKLDGGTLVLSYQFTDGGASYDGTKPFGGYGSYGGGGIAYSTDNGVTWTKATYPARTSTTAYGKNYGRIAICASGNTLYGLFQDGAVPDSQFFPPRTASSTTAGGQLLKSTDGGRNWTIITAAGLFNLASDGAQTGYNHLIAVDPTNPDLVFAGSNLALWRSMDGGANFSQFAHWSQVSRQYIHADMHLGVWTPTTQTGNAKALYIATDGGLSIVRNPNIATIPTTNTPDPTLIDHRRNRGIATHLVYNIGSTNATLPATGGIQPVRDRIVAGFQDLGTLVRYNNTTRPYLYRYTGSGGDGFGCAYHPYDGNLVLASVYYTQIRKSTNGGISGFASAVSGIDRSDSNSPFYTRIYLGMADPTGNSVYTFTNAVPYRSSNFADSWTAMATTAASGWPYEGATNAVTQIRSMNVSPLRRGLVGVLTDVNDAAVPIAQRRGTIILSRDNGLTWKANLSAFPNNRGYLSDIAFDTKDENTMYVTSVYPSTWNKAGMALGENYNHIWKSIDGGLTFTPVDGTATNSNGFPFGVMVYTAKVDPLDNQVVYAGTELGLYYTKNGGQTWERHGTGLPMVAIYDIYIAPDASFMRLGTHGRGIWEMDGVTSPYAPIISSHPVATAVNTGAQASFTAVAVGIPAPSYQWQVSANGGSTWDNISGATTGTYTFTTAASDNNKRYRMVASNSAGNTSSNPAVLTVLVPAPPSFVTNPTSKAVNAGSRVTFTAEATGTPVPTSKWQISRNDGVSWADRAYDTNYFSAPWIAQANPLGFYPAPEDSGALIRMSATNANGATPSSAAKLTVDAMNRQMLRNPEFEEYATDPAYPAGYPGVGWTWSDRARMAASAEASGENDAAGMGAGTTPGRRCAWLATWGASKTDWVYQDVVIPSDVTSARLTFRLAVVNFGAAASTAANRFEALIKDPSSGATLTTVFTADDKSSDATVSPAVSYQTKPSATGFDLMPWKGRTVRVYFTSTQTNAAHDAAFFVDNAYVSLTRGEAARYDLDDAIGLDVFDVLKFLSLHGSTSTADIALADFSGDGRIDDADLRLMLDALGKL